MMTIADLRAQKLVLFEVVAGSKAFGLDHPHSDTDIKGVFYLPKTDFYRGEYVAQVNNESHDEVFYELGRFIDLLAKSNPTALEMLASPVSCIVQKHPIMDILRLESLLSLEAVDTFCNYAMAQVRKAQGLNKKIHQPMDPQKKDLLDFCYLIVGKDSVACKHWLAEKGWQQQNCGLAKLNHAKGMYALYHDEHKGAAFKGILSKKDSHDVSCSSIPKDMPMSAYLYVNQEAYSSYCKTYREYFAWVSQRNEHRFQTNMQHNRGYDSKNMMHTIRLLELAKEIVAQRTITLRCENRDELLAIKAGDLDYDSLLDKALQLEAEITSLKKDSSLPENINKQLLYEYLLQARTELYT